MTFEIQNRISKFKYIHSKLSIMEKKKGCHIAKIKEASN